MKRFYQETSVDAADGGFCVLLDGRPMKTPAGHRLILPVEGLAGDVAEEWDAQAEEIQPDVMPITRLATTAHDRMPGLRTAAIQEVAGYAGTDLVCYRADRPDELVKRQHQAWQPILDWMVERYGIDFDVTVALVPLEQSDATLDGVLGIIEAIGDWPLVGVHGATVGLGSVVLALALWHGRLEADAASDASLVDALFEIDQWGEERDAAKRHATLRHDIQGAWRFLQHFPPDRSYGRNNNS